MSILARQVAALREAWSGADFPDFVVEGFTPSRAKDAFLVSDQLTFRLKLLSFCRLQVHFEGSYVPATI